MVVHYTYFFAMVDLLKRYGGYCATSSSARCPDVSPLLLGEGGAAMIGNLAAIYYRLANGANVNAVDSANNTALHWGAVGGHAGVARVLIAEGISVRTTKTGGETALHIAAFGGHVDYAAVLIEHDPGLVNVARNDGWTPLDIAFNHPEMQNFLKQKGGRCRSGNTAAYCP